MHYRSQRCFIPSILLVLIRDLLLDRHFRFLIRFIALCQERATFSINSNMFYWDPLISGIYNIAKQFKKFYYI